MVKEYDLIIVGGGCGGYPAAVYASRFNLKTLVITKLRGGLITTTHLVENYPGFISLSGTELANKLEAQVKANNVEIKDDIVSSCEKSDKKFLIKTEIGEEEFLAKTVLLATGSKHRHLGIKGEKEFIGKGVSYCATCDGNFYKDKISGIVGGGDSAVKEAMVLASVCSRVYMFVRHNLKAEPINEDRIRKLDNVKIIENIQVKEIKGSKFVESVLLNNGEEIALEGLFVAVGMLPQNDLGKSLGVELNKGGEIIIDSDSKTNIGGILAAGDVTNTPWKQGIIASAQGSTAAHSAFEYIQREF